jgi:hypothetical protein
VTIFRVDASESSDAWAAGILPDVELHHGEYSHHPPVSTLEIHGAALSPGLQSALQALGFADVHAIESFIIASLSHAV